MSLAARRWSIQTTKPMVPFEAMPRVCLSPAGAVKTSGDTGCSGDVGAGKVEAKAVWARKARARERGRMGAPVTATLYGAPTSGVWYSADGTAANDVAEDAAEYALDIAAVGIDAVVGDD